MESRKIIHWVWHDRPNEALCGKDVSNERFTENERVTCKDCVYIDTICRLDELKEENDD